MVNNVAICKLWKSVYSTLLYSNMFMGIFGHVFGGTWEVAQYFVFVTECVLHTGPNHGSWQDAQMGYWQQSKEKERCYNIVYFPAFKKCEEVFLFIIL